jgi:GTP diphosphokinase / guanosine-3',5'-bis(diphosphate) 3'-diphosphatase
MIRQPELVERVARYNANTNEALLNRAYVYAYKQHSHQKRANGDAYFTHPLEVAAILTDLKVDDATIVAALLHDTIEDTAATREEIERMFGREIAELVVGLTKIKKLDLVSKRAVQAENLRKLLLAITSDVRVLLVKLADRLHNMRTLNFMAPEKRARIADETLEIYAPLAGRMGMQDMREELEDLGFRYSQPEAYKVVSDRLNAARDKIGKGIDLIEDQIERLLERQGIQCSVRGREKKPYSIWRKQERKSISFGQLSDIFGFRVVVNTVDDCYRAVGVLHTTWPVVPGRFKDYISTPKSNDYRSIHTTLVATGNQRIELQVRTHEMNSIAEYGIAAHALYKDGAFVTTTDGRKVLGEQNKPWQWLSKMVAGLRDGAPEEFIEHTKLELFQDQVFCFSPKGKLIALPRGATPIDFAYAVHTDIGNTCVGTKINGRPAPLTAELVNGDEVEIVTSTGQTPPQAWESIAITGKARYEIRKATRAAVRHQYANLGRSLLKRAFEREGKVFDEDHVTAVLRRLARQTLEDVFAGVGRREMTTQDVLKAVYPDWQATAVPNGHSTKPDEDKEPSDNAIPVRGFSGGDVRFSPSGAVPGDRIVGIRMEDGIMIYPIQSESLQRFEDEPDRWVDMRWDIDLSDRRFPAKIALQSINEPGTLAQIASVIAEHQGNIDGVRMDRRTADITHITIDLSVYNLKHLNSIIAQLKTKSVIAAVERVVT